MSAEFKTESQRYELLVKLKVAHKLADAQSEMIKILRPSTENSGQDVGIEVGSEKVRAQIKWTSELVDLNNLAEFFARDENINLDTIILPGIFKAKPSNRLESLQSTHFEQLRNIDTVIFPENIVLAIYDPEDKKLAARTGACIERFATITRPKIINAETEKLFRDNIEKIIASYKEAEVEDNEQEERPLLGAAANPADALFARKRGKTWCEKITEEVFSCCFSAGLS